MMKHIFALAVTGVLLFSAASGEDLGANTPAKPSAETRMADIRKLIAEGKFPDSNKQIRIWMDENKKADLPWSLLAETAVMRKSYKKALSYGTKALDRNSENPWAYYWRGVAYENLKDWMESANEFRAALLIKPDMTEATEGLNRVKGNLVLPQVDARQAETSNH